jgi:hypothetical protein
MRSTVAAAVVFTCLVPLSAGAQEPPPPLPPPPPPPAAEVAAPPAPAPTAAPGLNWEAQVDTFSLYNFTGEPAGQAPSVRVFDNRSSSFTLNMAKIATYMTADPVGFRIDLIYGNIGLVSNRLGAAASLASGAGLYPGGLFVEQAFATLKGGVFTLDVGRFVTSASDEVIETKSNWNYSRSLLFLAQPAFHTGARLGVAINQILAVQLGVVNGWNNDPDNNTNKTFGGQVALTLPSRTNAFFTTYIGNESPGGGGQTTMLFDLVVGQIVGDRFALSLNADYWQSGDPSWFGIGLKAKLGLHENFYLAPRVEYVNSQSGGYGIDAGLGMSHPLSTDGGSLYEFTVTGGVPVKQNYEIRVEFRGDFTDKDGVFVKGVTPRKSQFTGLVGFLAWLP